MITPLLKNEAFRERLLGAEDRDEIYSIIMEEEENAL